MNQSNDTAESHTAESHGPGADATDAGIESTTAGISTGAADALQTQGERTEESEGTIKELTPEEEAREAIAAVAKLGSLFDAAVKAIKPVRLVVETQKLDRAAFFRNFKGQRMEKFTRPVMSTVLRREIFTRKNALMAQLFMVLWNEANRDLYVAMRKHVETINKDVEKIELIDDENAQAFVTDLLGKGFALEDIYICVRLNEVRFSPEFIDANVTPQGFKPLPSAA